MGISDAGLVWQCRAGSFTGENPRYEFHRRPRRQGLNLPSFARVLDFGEGCTKGLFRLQDRLAVANDLSLS
jgi:hypothetical protein